MAGPTRALVCSCRFRSFPLISSMARLATRAPEPTAGTERTKAPSVLVILVAKEGAAWLPTCLASVARQTHPRIGILAVDDASADGSADLLEQVLGPERLLRRDTTGGFGRAVADAMESELAGQADFVLLLHDDTALDPGAVEALVEAAGRVDGVGVVGPKVLDWDEPEVLQDIGRSLDRFGYPYSPLEDGEIDQGQYDRIREVLSVSPCAILVSRAAWSRIGPPDDRLPAAGDDADYCWRARLAGFRVVMTPAAVARHRRAGWRGERAATGRRRERFDRERSALASLLKNYGLLSLLSVLPAYAATGLIRLAVFAIGRRFDDAYQLLAAWGWNLLHLPGTVRRRIRTQSVRSVPDRVVRRAMAPTAIRARRLALRLTQTILPSSDVAAGEEAAPVPVGHRLRRLALAHPVLTSVIAGLLLGALAYRNLIQAAPLTGGALGTTPANAAGYFRELVSGLRHSGLGGSEAASPALGLLGVGSVVAFGSPTLFMKLLVLLLPWAATVGCYRAVREVVRHPVPAMVAAGCYGLSGVVLWSVSEGRIAELVLLAGLPWLATKLALPFGPSFRVRPMRHVVGAAMGIAVLASFFPGTILAAAVLTLALVLIPASGTRWGRGVALGVAAAAVASVLVFPFALELVRGGGVGLGGEAETTSFAHLLRLSPGPGPGAWITGLYLPVAGALAILFVRGRAGLPAVRATVSGLLGCYLAWASAAGYLPAPLSNPVAYVGVAAFSFSLMVGLGLSAIVRGVSDVEFGHRQVGGAVLTLVLVVGLGGQILQAARGNWSIGGPERIPPAFALTATATGMPFRVLWLGEPGGRPFAAPGGLPQGTAAAGSASVRFAIRGPEGATTLDVGRSLDGPGGTYLRQALVEVLSGRGRHGGALLAPFAVRFVVASPADIPGAALRRLGRQLDLDAVPTQGLLIFQNERLIPPAADLAGRDWAAAAGSPSVDVLAALGPPEATALLPVDAGQGFTGRAGSAEDLLFLSQPFDERWRLGSAGASGRPAKAFGWATGLHPPTAGPVLVRFHGQQTRTVQIGLLAVLWIMAAWVTRRQRHG